MSAQAEPTQAAVRRPLTASRPATARDANYGTSERNALSGYRHLRILVR
jgi:hypothetical protein